jgi:hypothetical protein
LPEGDDHSPGGTGGAGRGDAKHAAVSNTKLLLHTHELTLRNMASRFPPSFR